ncbi:hypothetical protein, partial [Pseudoneobacillus sp. C159]
WLPISTLPLKIGRQDWLLATDFNSSHKNRATRQDLGYRFQLFTQKSVVKTGSWLPISNLLFKIGRQDRSLATDFNFSHKNRATRLALGYRSPSSYRMHLRK